MALRLSLAFQGGLKMDRRTFAAGAAFVALSPKLARAGDGVAGRFVANGKPAKLSFVSAYLNDKDALVIVATEKNHSASKNPATDAEFGKFGSAVTITLHNPQGDVVQAQLVHSSFAQSPVTLIGRIKGSDVKIAGDRVDGHFKTEGPVMMFEGKPYQTSFDVDLVVGAPILPK
jgi:hypothetical protein